MSAVARAWPMPSALALLAALVGCHGDRGWSGDVPSADAASFQATAYPVLMRDCAFTECHGAPQRFLQVFGPGRTRLDPQTKTDEPPTLDELQVSYERTLSVLALEGAFGIEDSRLLRKPLAISAGGVGHEGVDVYGRNVFPDKFSPGYVALLHWAETAMGASSAVAPPLAGTGSR